MSRLTVNGITLNGTSDAIGYTLLVVKRAIESGENHLVVSDGTADDGSPVKTVFYITPATQFSAVIEGDLDTSPTAQAIYDNLGELAERFGIGKHDPDEDEPLLVI